jgi:hypothetical protein
MHIRRPRRTHFKAGFRRLPVRFLHKTVRLLQRADPRQTQRLYQPILQHPMATLHAPFRLRTMSTNQFDFQLPHRPPKLAHRLLPRQRLIHRRITRHSINTVPIHVQRTRKSLVVADAGFTGYDLFRRVLAAEQNFLLRVGSNVHLLQKLGYAEQEGRNTVYLWPAKHRHEPPVVLRLIERRQGKKKMYLVTNVLDEKALSEKSAGVLYEMRWGVEVFYRSVKQTLQRRRMLSRTPDAAQCELTWTVFGIWLLGLMSVAKIIGRGADPLSWSAALARERVRQSMRLALTGWHQDRALLPDLAWAIKDDYERHRRKKARNWPHKKTEKPPGNPIIQPANAKQKKAMQRLKARKNAA